MINGIVEIGDSPIEPQKKAHIIVATKIKESLKTTWKRGSVTLVGDQSYTEINQKLKERISGALQPYVGSNTFLFLNNEIMQQFKNQEKSNNKYLITECQQCGKLEIYHAFEIANKCCTPMLCRNCGKSKYKNLCEVPFSDTFLIDIFGEFTDIFDFMQKSQEPPKELVEKLLKYAKLDHHLVVGVVYEDLRNHYKKKFQYDNYVLMNKIDEVIEQAKCNEPFFENFLKLDDKFSTLQSFQTTTDITDTFGKIDNDIKNKYLDFYFQDLSTLWLMIVLSI